MIENRNEFKKKTTYCGCGGTRDEGE